jgi:hypothetical protein
MGTRPTTRLLEDQTAHDGGRADGEGRDGEPDAPQAAGGYGHL